MKTKRLLSVALFILSLIYFLSCSDFFEERIEGNNNVVIKERIISPFNEVISTGIFDVYITIADSISLFVEAEENLFAFIITKVKGDKFYAEVKDNYRLVPNETIKIYITTPNLNTAMLTGSGNILCDSLTNDYLDLDLTGSGKIIFNNIDILELDGDITGSGNIILSGSNDRSDLIITGSGNIRSLDLIQNTCEAEITGSGNIYVNVIEHLDAEISGSGSIYYLGNPIVEKHITGSGTVGRY
jgi:hypothetical protein